MEQVICKNLDFIQDGHFSIGRSQICKDYNMYINEKYIRPSIDKGGNIVYRLCRLDQSNEDILSLDLKLKDGNKNNNISIKLENTSKNYVYKRSNNSYEYEEIYNIPVIDLRGNFGGNEIYAFDWIKNFTNQEYKAPGFSSALLTKNSKDVEYRLLRFIKNYSSYRSHS